MSRKFLDILQPDQASQIGCAEGKKDVEQNNFLPGLTVALNLSMLSLLQDIRLMFLDVHFNTIYL